MTKREGLGSNYFDKEAVPIRCYKTDATFAKNNMEEIGEEAVCESSASTIQLRQSNENSKNDIDTISSNRDLPERLAGSKEYTREEPSDKYNADKMKHTKGTIQNLISELNLSSKVIPNKHFPQQRLFTKEVKNTQVKALAQSRKESPYKETSSKRLVNRSFGANQHYSEYSDEELDKLRRLLKEKDRENERLRRELHSVESSKEEAIKAKDIELQSLRAAAEKLQRKICVLESESPNSEIIEMYDREIVQYRDNLWDEFAGIKKMLAESNAVKEMPKHLMKLLCKLEASLKEVSSENSELREKVRKLKANGKKSKGASYLKTELEKANLLIKEFESVVNSLQSKYKDNSKELTQAKEEIERLGSKNNSLISELSKAKQLPKTAPYASKAKSVKHSRKSSKENMRGMMVDDKEVGNSQAILIELLAKIYHSLNVLHS